MRVLSYDTVVSAVRQLIMETNYNLPWDIVSALRDARESETSEPAGSILDQIIQNADVARGERLPLCQDTGVAVFFADVGVDVQVNGAGMSDAVQAGTRSGYADGLLRKSIVRDPFRRENTGDNTPAIIHCRQVPGDKLTLLYCPKGGGCENMSRLAMLTPGDGRIGVVDFVVETVRLGGGRPCPPLVIGVGVGGDFEYAPQIAKRSLFRKVGERNPDNYLAALETELLERINGLGIGPMGLGGAVTALDVFVETAPCHIASFPVAVNIQCHSARHSRVEL